MKIIESNENESTGMRDNSKKVFVAFLDILGFKSYVLKSSIEKVQHDIKELFSLGSIIAMAYASTTRHNSSAVDSDKVQPTSIISTPDGKQKSLINLNVSNINSILIFDSIVLWTKDSNENDLIELLAVIKIMLDSHLFMGLPLRGAISYGELCFQDLQISSGSIVKHSVLVSPAQICAMSLEKKQEWSGCVLHETVVTRCREINMDLDHHNSRLITKYRVPLNEGEIALYALIWGIRMSGNEVCNVDEYVKDTWPVPDGENREKILKKLTIPLNL